MHRPVPVVLTSGLPDRAGCLSHSLQTPAIDGWLRLRPNKNRAGPNTNAALMLGKAR
jgi:hypothetical protein